jgi:hypothetical protein
LVLLLLAMDTSEKKAEKSSLGPERRLEIKEVNGASDFVKA